MIRTCDNCPYGGVKVSYRGPIDSPLVIVGEGPTPMELARKTAFIGPQNDLLQQMLSKAGFTALGIEPLYVYAVECLIRDKLTGDKKVKNAKTGITETTMGGKKKFICAVDSCRFRLFDIIALHPRHMVMALGSGALQSLAMDHKLKITQERGSLIDDGRSACGTVVLAHPTFMMKGGGSLQQYQDDFAKAFEIWNGKPFERYYEPESFHLIDTPLKYKYLCHLLKKKGKIPVAADIETGGFNFWEHEMLELVVTYNGHHVYVIPPEFLTEEIFDNTCDWVWHNGKFDIKFFWAMGIWNARISEDTMLLSYCMNAVKGIHGLEQVAWDWLRAPDYKGEIKQWLPTKDTSYREIPAPIRRKYAARDGSRTFQLYHVMRKALEKDPVLVKNYTRVLIPGANYLARVEWNGFKTDRAWVKLHMDSMEAELKELQAEFQALAIKEWGKEVNTNSPKQLAEYLYGHLKLAHPHQSTDRETLEELPFNECLEPLLKIRRIQKYLSTYVYPCWEKVDGNGRIHAAYNLHGTKTGRLSSNGPNMQNIPRKPEVRGMFIAEEGKILIECDLSQAELRSLAQLSGDDELIRIYNSDTLSLHDEVTAEIWPEYTSNELTKEEKKELKMRGKAVNFGIVYGRQAFSFVQEFEISLKEAQRWIEKWLSRFPKARTYINRCREAVDKGQTLVTIFGRKRKFGVITVERRQKLQNEASNFPHQSTASDITLLAGIECEPILRERFGAKIVNTVHDCIVIEAYPYQVAEIAHLVTSTMVRIPRDWGMHRVPFESEAEVGPRWGNLSGFNVHEGQYHCPTCKSVGFLPSTKESNMCTFCDGTEGGQNAQISA